MKWNMLHPFYRKACSRRAFPKKEKAADGVGSHKTKR
jgi:hypothetical protein